MEMFNSLLLPCVSGGEVGLDRLLCSKTSELLQDLQQYSSYLALLGGRLPRAFQKGYPHYPLFTDKETERRHDLPKVPLWR